MQNNKSNQTAKKKHKINVIDIVVFGIVLAIAAMSFIWIDPLGWLKEDIAIEEKTILCVVELSECSPNIANKIIIDDDVVILTDGVEIGRVVNITKSPSYSWEIPTEGDQMALVENKDKITMYVTIEIECSYKEGIGYFLHDYQLLVGETIELKFPSPVIISGECVSIQVKE